LQCLYYKYYSLPINSPIRHVRKRIEKEIDSECRVFNEKWSLDYFVIYSGDKIICLICKESISVLKEYNIRRHYETKQKTTFSKFTEKLRLDKLQSLQNNFSSQQLLFKKL
jgi:hypothetical protein